MTIQDTEVLALFEQEAAERLDALGTLLLELEADGLSDDLIARLFREAHTLKGAANVVGLNRLGAEAHELEDLFDHVRAGKIPVTPELIDQMLAAVDKLIELSGVEVRDSSLDEEPEPVAEPELAAVPPLGADPDSELDDDPFASLTSRLPAPPRPEVPRPSIDPSRSSVPGEALSALASARPPERPRPTAPPRVPAAEPAPAPERAPAPATRTPTARAPKAAEHVATDDSDVAPETESEGPADRDTDRHETARVAVDRLDSIVRMAGESAAAHLRLAQLIKDELGIDPYGVPEVRAMSRLLTDLQQGALRARMLPIAAAEPALRRAVRDISRRTGKQVELVFRGEDTELDRAVHERVVDGLIHIVRNALDHGIEHPEDRGAVGKPSRGSVIVHAMQLGSRVVVTVTDDGRGVDIAAVRKKAQSLGIDTLGLEDADVLELLFHPGLTTAPEVTDLSGRGVGLDAVRESLAELRGRVDVETTEGHGTVFRISVPITLTVLRGLIVRAGGQRYAIPMGNVLTVIGPDTPVERVEGHPAVRVDRSVVAISSLAEMLGARGGVEGPIVVVTGVSQTHAFCVDGLEGERDVLLKRLPAPAPATDLVVGASAEPDGTVMLVLDGESLVDGALTRGRSGRFSGHQPMAIPTPQRARRILVVDDALTVRELQRIILERAGYTVTTAEDGRDALERIDAAEPDLVLTDVEMPNLDGLGLVREIRAHESFSNVPVVVLTSRGEDEDRQAGLEAGADAYIIKSSFDEASLLGVVERLLGAVA